MSNFYTSNVKLVVGKLNYLVPDVHKIFGAKYKWFPENKGIPNSIQCVCCFEYPDFISNTEDLKSITEKEYTDFGKVIVSVDKTLINANNTDYPTITAKFSEAGGTATFYITKPDGEKTEFKAAIPENKTVTLPKEHIITTKIGSTKISIKSEKWSNVSGLDEISIDST